MLKEIQRKCPHCKKTFNRNVWFQQHFTTKRCSKQLHFYMKLGLKDLMGITDDEHRKYERAYRKGTNEDIARY